MAELNEQLDTSFIVVTHDEEFASTLDRVLQLRNGKLELVEVPAQKRGSDVASAEQGVPPHAD